MAIITTGSYSKALKPGVDAWVNMTYNEYEPQYRGLFKKINTQQNFVEAVGSYGTALAVKVPEGESVSYDTMAQGFIRRSKPDKYALGLQITEEAMEDGQYMEIAEYRAKQLARSLRETKENVAANIFNRAFNASYTGYDGVALCDLNHKRSRGGTFKNELTTAADLSEASLEQMCIDLMDFRDESGRRISVKPKKLLIPTELIFDAERILKSTLRVDSANNDLNALRSKGLFNEVCVNQYLSSATAFFVLTDCPDGLIQVQRRGIRVDDETAFNTGNVKFKASERYIFDWRDPRCVFGTPGAGQ